MKPSRNKIIFAVRACFLGVLAILTVAVAVVPRITEYRWIWVHGPSVNVTVGLLRSGMPEKVKAGDYVMLAWKGVDPNGVTKLQQGTTIIKKIACLPGQHLKVTMQHADCDGAKVGHIRYETIDGKPITPVFYDGVIPAGHLFLVGEHYYSYDSRYFGLVPLEWLVGTLTRII